ncbi:hypothetical protein [Actinocorallia longicatena]|uniref:Lipoprotein LprG n=1 Tax=Actinocorallia longicatena TaxID=111803 RepID=A0ABP6Q1K8_9ACTN
MPRQGVALGMAAVLVAGVGVWAAARNAGADDLVPTLSADAPFLGSPAEDYADGADGVAPPPARAIGGFSAAQVAAAYQGTERTVEAAALDRATLEGAAPAAFLAAIDPAQAAVLGDRARSQVVSLAPGSAELVGERIKVRGTMKAAPATYHGRNGLHVSVDYTFVYALRNPKAPARIMRFRAHLKGTTFEAPGRKTSVLEQSVTAAPALSGGDGHLHPDWSFDAPQS